MVDGHRIYTIECINAFLLDPLIYVVRLEQRQHFPSLFAYLRDHKVKVAHDIKNFACQLDLYLDSHNLIRSRGRIQYANMGDDAKAPYLLPPHSHVTTLIVRHHHVNNHHCRVHTLGTDPSALLHTEGLSSPKIPA